jgi:hypothetical protein
MVSRVLEVPVGTGLFVRLYKTNGPVNKEAVWHRPNSTILKGLSCNLPLMLIRTRHIATIVALSLAGFALGGCGTINEKLANGLGDYIPQWAGGLPPDAPPRPGTPKYDEMMKERERKRLEPAPPSDAAAKANASLDPVH